VSAAETTGARGLPIAPRADPRPNAWWGMLLVVLTESSLFALLLH
jgi:hypothetical protein